MRKQRLRLIGQMALHRSIVACCTVFLALMLVMTCTWVGSFVVAHNAVVEQGAQGSFGKYSLQVTGNEDVANYMRELEADGAAVTVSHGRQNLLAANNDRATNADVTLTSGPADLGDLVSGRYPSQAHELTVSAAVARWTSLDFSAHLT